MIVSIKAVFTTAAEADIHTLTEARTVHRKSDIDQLRHLLQTV